MQSINDSMFENFKPNQISQLNKILGGASVSARDGDCSTGSRQYDGTKPTAEDNSIETHPDCDQNWGKCEPKRKEDTCILIANTPTKTLMTGASAQY